MSQPARRALDGLVLFVGGLGALVVLALVTYEPGGPRWPHVVVDGTGWTLITVCGLIWLVAGAEAALAHWRRR